MKFVRLAIIFSTMIQAASAASCVLGTLSSYEALGAGGCSIGGTNFGSFAGLSGITGATAIAPGSVTITPGGSLTTPMLTFTVSQTVRLGSLSEVIFTYQASAMSFLLDKISLSGSAETGNGAVTYTQNYCAGGVFGPDGVSGCSGSATGALVTLDGIQNTDQIGLLGPKTLAITSDFVLDGGGTGTAAGGIFVDQFTTTTSAPEPSTYSLVFASVALLGVRRLRSARLRPNLFTR